MGYYVYKHLDKNNDVIYIGQTKNINNRQREHKSHSKWFYKVYKIIYTELNDKLLTDIYEKLYIDTYSPAYNTKDIDCKYSRFFKNMKELEFKEYVFENNNINLNDTYEKIIYFETNKNFELNDNFKNVLYEILAMFKHSDKIDISKLITRIK